MQIMDSHMRAALEMPPEEGQRFLKALTAYLEDGAVPDFSDPADWPLKAVWTAIAPVLETSKDISAKRSQAGRRGAAARERARSATAAPQRDGAAGNGEANVPSGDESDASADANSGERDAGTSKEHANASKLDANASGREEEEEGKEKGQGHGRAKARFSPPSPAEVDAYAAEAGISLDSCSFVDYYASKGWKVGSQPMRDWRAAARNWARRDKGGSKIVPFSRPQRPTGAVSDDVLAAYL